jgi:hypothetical protein
MAYNPEKTNANTSGNKPPSSKNVDPKTLKGLGKTALGGGKK